ncbi:MAG: polysaccharide biosynthesis tyrosine autokinase [bacterium]
MQSKDTQYLFTQFHNILKRRKWLIFLCVLGVLAPIILYNETSPKVYQASVSIIFEQMSHPLRNDAFDPMRRFYRETYLLNRIEEIKSLSLAEEIAAALPSNLVNRFNFPEELSLNFDKVKFITKKIKSSISTSLVRKTDVIKIKVLTHDPFLSMSLANKAADVLRERNLKLKRNEVSGLRQFIEEQLSIFQEKLSRSEKKLMQFKENHRITSLERESAEILRRITDAEVKYNQVKAQRKSTEERLTVIYSKISDKRKELVPTITNVRSPWLQKLKDRLIELQVQYTQLQVQDYKTGHPKMVQLQEEIKQTKKSLTEEALKLAKGEIVVDPLSQIHTYLTETLSLEIELETLKAQEKALKKVLNEYENSLKSLPAKELELANIMRAKNVSEKIYMMLMEKHEEARITEAEKMANLRIIDMAQLPKSPIKPRKRYNLAIGMLMGLFVGFGLAFLLESINTRLKTVDEIEKLTSWPVLSVIPNFEFSKNGKFDFSKISQNNIPKESEARRGLLSSFEPNSIAAEAFRVLRTNMQFLNSQRKIKTVLITSISAQEGKSTTSTNLGITLTNLELRVLLIDADLRRPTIHKLFDLAKEPGLSDVLISHHTIVNDLVAEDREKEFYNKASESPMWATIQKLKSHQKEVKTLEQNFQEFTLENSGNNNKIIQPQSQYINLLNTSLIETIQATKIKNLKVLTSGKYLLNPSEILSTVSMKCLLDQVSKKFDLVLIDSPPLLLVPDSMVLSSIVDGVLIVIETNKNEQDMVLNVQKFLEKTNSNVIGVVLNRVDPKMLYKDKDYYYYG